MKHILENWEGRFEINGEIKENLNEWNPKNGEQFKLKLIRRGEENEKRS